MNRKLKWMALMVAVAFMGQELAVAAPVLAPSMPVAASKPEVGFVLPESVALIDDGFKAPAADAKTIFLIQDAHTNESGQMNEAKALAEILPSENIRHVFTEGADNDASLSFLKEFFPKDVLRKTSISFVRKGIMKGSEFASVNGDHEFALIGVEDEELYDQALESFVDILKRRDKAVQYLDRVGRAASTLKESIYSEELKALDAQESAYRAGELPLTDYFAALHAQARKTGVYLPQYPHLSFLNELKKSESKVDFNQVSKEQEAALKSLPEEDQKTLAAASKEKHSPFRMGGGEKSTEKAFYALLEEKLAGRSAAYPALSRYFGYLKQTKKLDAQSILNELKAFEMDVFGRLAVTQDEQFLVVLSKNLVSLENLLEIKLSPEEFSAFRRDSAVFDIKVIGGFFNKKIMGLGKHHDQAVLLEKDYDEAVKTASEFYELTYRRDEAFVRNMLTRMDADQAAKAVLVTGGYHTPSLKRMLKDKGISYVSIMPQILHETDMARYQKIVTSQLFDAQKETRLAQARSKANAFMPKDLRSRGVADFITVAASNLPKDQQESVVTEALAAARLAVSSPDPLQGTLMRIEQGMLSSSFGDAALNLRAKDRAGLRGVWDLRWRRPYSSVGAEQHLSQHLFPSILREAAMPRLTTPKTDAEADDERIKSLVAQAKAGDSKALDDLYLLLYPSIKKAIDIKIQERTRDGKFSWLKNERGDILSIVYLQTLPDVVRAFNPATLRNSGRGAENFKRYLIRSVYNLIVKLVIQRRNVFLNANFDEHPSPIAAPPAILEELEQASLETRVVSDLVDDILQSANSEQAKEELMGVLSGILNYGDNDSVISHETGIAEPRVALIRQEIVSQYSEFNFKAKGNIRWRVCLVNIYDFLAIRKILKNSDPRKIKNILSKNPARADIVYRALRLRYGADGTPKRLEEIVKETHASNASVVWSRIQAGVAAIKANDPVFSGVYSDFESSAENGPSAARLADMSISGEGWSEFGHLAKESNPQPATPVQYSPETGPVIEGAVVGKTASEEGAIAPQVALPNQTNAARLATNINRRQFLIDATKAAATTVVASQILRTTPVQAEEPSELVPGSTLNLFDEYGTKAGETWASKFAFTGGALDASQTLKFVVTPEDSLEGFMIRLTKQKDDEDPWILTFKKVNGKWGVSTSPKLSAPKAAEQFADKVAVDADGNIVVTVPVALIPASARSPKEIHIHAGKVISTGPQGRGIQINLNKTNGPNLQSAAVEISEKSGARLATLKELEARPLDKWNAVNLTDFVLSAASVKRVQEGADLSRYEIRGAGRTLSAEVMNRYQSGTVFQIAVSWQDDASTSKTLYANPSDNYSLDSLAEILMGRVEAEQTAPKSAEQTTRAMRLDELDSEQLADILRELVRTDKLAEYPVQSKFLLYSAAPGTGKGALWETAFDPDKGGSFSDITEKVVLFHTRKMRAGEVDGVHYHFRTVDQLRDLEQRGLILTTLINGQVQGLAIKSFEDVRQDGTPAQVRGLEGIFSGDKLAILEGGMGWFDFLRSRPEYNGVPAFFLTPLPENVIQIREKNLQVIKRTFPTDREQALALEIMMRLFSRDGESDLSNPAYVGQLNRIKEGVTQIIKGGDYDERFENIFGFSDEDKDKNLKSLVERFSRAYFLRVLNEIQNDPRGAADVEAAMASVLGSRLATGPKGPSWIRQYAPHVADSQIVEVTMEMALSEPIMSALETRLRQSGLEEEAIEHELRKAAMSTSVGGIGPLLGERVPELSNLGANVTAVSLLYNQVWVQKRRPDGTLSSEKEQVHPELRNVMEPAGEVTIEMYDGTKISARVLKAPRGAYQQADVYFIDVPFLADTIWARSNVVYPGAKDVSRANAELARFNQSWILGRGTLALMKILKRRPDLVIMSEASSMFAHHRVFRDSHSDDPFFDNTRYVFNDHTPLDYAHPKWSSQVLRLLRVDERFWGENLPVWDADGRVDATALMINASDIVYGVAKKHAEVMRGMVGLRRLAEKIRHVTNGVSVEWADREFRDLERVRAIPDEELIQMKRVRKAAMLHWLARRQGMDPGWAGRMLAENRPVGLWTRRIVEYKRLGVFADLLENTELREEFIRSGIIFIFGGRTHQDDDYGIRQYNRIQESVKRDPRLKDQVIFFENYNRWEAVKLFRGVDFSVMLADDGREASATGFQKAQLSGSLIIASNDGAIPESVKFLDPAPGLPIRGANGFNVPYVNDQPTAGGLMDAFGRFRRIYDQPDKLAAMIRNALRQAEFVSVRRTAEDMLRLFDQEVRVLDHYRIDTKEADAQSDALFSESGIDAGTARALLKELEADKSRFVWKFKEDYVSEKTLVTSEPGIAGFLRGLDRIRSMGSVGEWSLKFHAGAENYRGDILNYLDYHISKMSDMGVLKAYVHAKHAEAEDASVNDKIRISLEVAEVIEHWIRRLERTAAQGSRLAAERQPSASVLDQVSADLARLAGLEGSIDRATLEAFIVRLMTANESQEASFPLLMGDGLVLVDVIRSEAGYRIRVNDREEDVLTNEEFASVRERNAANDRERSESTSQGLLEVVTATRADIDELKQLMSASKERIRVRVPVHRIFGAIQNPKQADRALYQAQSLLAMIGWASEHAQKNGLQGLDFHFPQEWLEQLPKAASEIRSLVESAESSGKYGNRIHLDQPNPKDFIINWMVGESPDDIAEFINLSGKKEFNLVIAENGRSVHRGLLPWFRGVNVPMKALSDYSERATAPDGNLETVLTQADSVRGPEVFEYIRRALSGTFDQTSITEAFKGNNWLILVNARLELFVIPIDQLVNAARMMADTTDTAA